MTRITLFLLVGLLGGHCLHATPLAVPTAVHLKPDTNAQVIVVLSAGTTPTPATAAIATTPAGWMAVQLPGPFDGYVLNSDIDKSLNVKPGVSIHHKPDSASGVLAIMEPEDKTTITGLHGKWSQIRLEKPVVGYIRVTTAAAPTLSTMSSPPAPAPAAYQAVPAMAPPAAVPDLRPNQPSGVLPRLFQGTFVSTRRPFTPRRPHDWQLNDAAGVRYAYLDLSRLMLTDQIENYAGREVIVQGTAGTAADGRNLVIMVETLRLK